MKNQRGNGAVVRFLFLLHLVSELVVELAIAENGCAEPGTVIGIDLGTTYSCVGVYNCYNKHVKIIANDQGNRTTPSWVAFTSNERLIGEAAKNLAAINPENTIFDVKRFLGTRFDDPEVQRDIKSVPYKVMNKDGQPYIQVKEKGENKLFSPEEISAMVIGRMKEIAEEYLGENIKDAAISVPAYFNDAQRQATKDAGSIVGLKVTHIIDEPVAAAIAYDLDRKEEKTNILVYNLGDHSFDVSILTVDNGVVEVLSTNGDTHLGGEDFDRRVTDYFVELIKNKYNKDITKDKRALLKLRRECERANIALSSQQEYRVEIESVFHEIGFSEALTRARFEELNMDLFKKTLGSVKRALEDAGLNESDIDEIVLVGGSTRIPKVQQLLKDLFDGKELKRGINPDEIIAYGAAVQAGKENKGLEVTERKTRKCVVHELGRASSIDAGRAVHVKAKVKGIRKLDHKTMEIPESILKDDEKSSRKIRKVKNKAWYKLKNYILYIFFAINYKQVLADDAPINFEEKETMEKVLIKTLRWLRDNEMATENEIQEKRKQLDAVFHPIIEQFHDQL